MSIGLPEGENRITPYILYEDVAAALKWLAAAFGFRERLRYAGEDGVVTHAEMTFEDGVIMLGHPGPEYQNPKTTGYTSQFPYILVEDVDRHAKSASAAGATILREPEDQPYGHRVYEAVDLEGHHWWFAEPVRKVPPEEWGAATT